MADIIKCSNAQECPKKNTCYRYTAYPSDLQFYAEYFVKDKECKNYWPTESNDFAIYVCEHGHCWSRKCEHYCWLD